MKSAIIGMLLVLTASQATLAFAAPAVPLTVIAIVKVKPGMEQAFKEAASRILAPTHLEAGSLSYEFHQGTQDPTAFATVEHWTSAQDLDGHLASPHMQQFFQEVGGMFEPGYPQITQYEKFGD